MCIVFCFSIFVINNVDGIIDHFLWKIKNVKKKKYLICNGLLFVTHVTIKYYLQGIWQIILYVIFSYKINEN